MESQGKYLTCENRLVFELLIMTAGIMGAYTFNLRGGVFSNAQTANVVLMAIAFGKKNILHGIYFLLPISAYLLGTILSEILPNPIKKVHLFRWDTLLIMFEMIILFGVGLIPTTASNHVVQIIINFVCAMQQNTFRQAESIPMATTLCTNHLRQFGVWGIKHIKNKDKSSLIRQKRHFLMICFFFLGGFLETIACNIFKEKAIWLVLFPLSINLFKLVKADLREEKDFFEKIPLGH